MMYPERDNSTYIDDSNRVHRIQNVQISKYELMKKVNGPTHVKLVQERQNAG